MHREFVDPVRCNVTYSGGYQARKEIHKRSPFFNSSQQTTVCIMNLGPARTNFNLGTRRFEIPSHSLTNDPISNYRHN